MTRLPPGPRKPPPEGARSLFAAGASPRTTPAPPPSPGASPGASPAAPPAVPERTGRLQRGFALIAVLWLVAVLALAASAFAVWVGRSTEEARRLRLRVVEEQALVQARASLLFGFLVQPMSGRGLEAAESLGALQQTMRSAAERLFSTDVGATGSAFVALDDRPYRFGPTQSGESVEIQVQDARGLINLNLATREELLRLLARLGIEQEKLDPLVARLQDYTDPDDLIRLNGAEREEYARAGRPPPANALLATTWEARRVLGWEAEPGLWTRDGLAAIAATSHAVGYNLNTAPATVLEIVAGMTAETAAAAVVARQTTPFVSFENLAGFGAPLVLNDPLRFILFPSDTMRATFTLPRSGRRVQMAFALTPNGTEAPWRIDYQVELESVAGNGRAASDPIPEFPDPATLLASR
jgi:type II secretory pathway component PulK